jgi:CRP/FNR family transcriptional regulator
MGALTRPSELDIAKCNRCPIRKNSFCGLAQGEAFEELAKISHIRTYGAGETIIAQNGNSHRVGRVISGVLKLVKSLPDGRDQIVGLIHPSHFFGRVYSKISEFSVDAATDVVLCSIDRAAFEALLSRYPAIEHEIHLLSLRQLDSARERIMLFACQTTTERLATYLALRLLQSRPMQGPASRERIVVHSAVNRRDLAGYLGTTVETVSRNLQHLSRIGIIRIIDSGRFEILNPKQLFDIAGQSEDDLLINMPREQNGDMLLVL